MKKRLALVLAGAAAFGSLGIHAALADGTPAGPVIVGIEGGGGDDYEIWIDGASTNADPFQGYAAVHSDGDVFCSTDNTGPYNDDGTMNEDFEEPQEGGNVKCPA